MDTITLEHLRKAFEGKTPQKGLTKKDIASKIREYYTPLSNATNEDLIPEINRILTSGIKDQVFTHKDRTPYYRLKRLVKKGELPKKAIKYDCNTSFEGAAGEMAVASELLLRGYNVNRLLIDEGIDLVAFKDKVIYNIQVKTTFLDERLTANFQISKATYDKQSENFVRYILVARCGEMENRFFVFSQSDINVLARDGYIKNNKETYGITIKFSQQDNCPYLTSAKKEHNIVHNQNNFKL